MSYLDQLMTNQPLEVDSISSFSEPTNKKSPIKYMDVLKRVSTKKSNKSKKSKKSKKQKGGEKSEKSEQSEEKDIQHIPHGGFPPIYFCDQVKQEEECFFS